LLRESVNVDLQDVLDLSLNDLVVVRWSSAKMVGQHAQLWERIEDVRRPGVVGMTL
jgi:hypothetical protein